MRSISLNEYGTNAFQNRIYDLLSSIPGAEILVNTRDYGS